MPDKIRIYIPEENHVVNFNEDTPEDFIKKYMDEKHSGKKYYGIWDEPTSESTLKFKKDKIARPTLEGATTRFGKSMEILSAPNYAMAQAVDALIKGEPVYEKAMRGLTLQEPRVFGDVVADVMEREQPRFQFEHPTASALLQTTLGLGGDILADPLTYVGAAQSKLAKNPLVKRAGKLISKKVGGAAIQNELIVDASRLFTQKVGSEAHKKAYDIFRKYEVMSQSRTYKYISEASKLDKEIIKLAKETGEDAGVLRRKIIRSVEKRAKVGNTTIDDIVSSIKEKNINQIRREQSLGIPIKELEGEVDYFVHAITPEGKKWLGKRGGKEFRGIRRKMTDKHASLLQRKYGNMSVAEANDMMRKRGFKGDFFLTDPARAQAIRDVRHATAVTGAEFFDEMGREFGHKVGVPGTENMVPVSVGRLRGKVFEPEVAAVIDTYDKKFINPKEVNTVLRLYDNVQNWWKSWTLGIFPQYHTRNAMGNVWNNFLAGVNSPIPYKIALDLQAGKNVTIKTMLGDMDSRMVMELAADRGIFGKGFYGGDIPRAVDDSLIRGSWLSPGSGNRLVKTGMKVGRAIEENARLAHFVDRIIKGYSPDEAAKSVKKFLFDYTELTAFEQNVMKRIFPFYSWTRKNLPLQMEMWARNPGKQMIPVKLKHEVERLSEKDSPPPEANVTEFLRGDYAVRVSGRTKEGKFKYAPIAGYLPWGDVARFVNEPAQNIGYMISPLLKEPYQQVVNKDLYFNKPITTPGLKQGLIIPGRGEEFTRFLGVKLSPRATHILRNIRLFSTIHRANPFQVFGSTRMGTNEIGTGQKLAQYILGIRNYEVDEVKGLVRGLREEGKKIDNLRTELNILGYELSRAKDKTHIKDIEDRIKLITEAIERTATEEVPKHIR
jgi:hypothetical protein